jgi:hypothetical protein
LINTGSTEAQWITGPQHWFLALNPSYLFILSHKNLSSYVDSFIEAWQFFTTVPVHHFQASSNFPVSYTILWNKYCYWVRISFCKVLHQWHRNLYDKISLQIHDNFYVCSIFRIPVKYHIFNCKITSHVGFMIFFF